MSVFTVQKRVRDVASKPKHLRRRGLLPMALVERTHETTLIQASVDALKEAMKHADGLGRVDLQIEGEKGQRKAIVKHIEHDPLKHELIHVTLQEVSEDDMMKMDILVAAIGTPEILETEEGILTQPTDHVKVRGKMSALPERIEVDVTQMQIGDHIEASALSLPDGVELISSADATIFSLKPPAIEVEPEVVEEAPEEDTLAEDGPAKTDHEGEE